jgi:beta-lactamase class A
MNYPNLLILLLLFIGGNSFSQPLIEKVAFPYDQDNYVEIGHNRSAYLQSLLEKEVRTNKHWVDLIRKKKMAISLVDLRNPCDLKYASINGEHMMYAASLPKIAVLLTAMEQIEKGALISTPEIEKDMRLMIAKSNNKATT